MSDEPSDAPVGNTKYARYILTKNNPGDWRPTFADTMAFMAWGCETAPTTGTPHIHVYIRFKVRKYWTWVKQQYPDTDIRIARGTSSSAATTATRTTENTENMEHSTPEPESKENVPIWMPWWLALDPEPRYERSPSATLQNFKIPRGIQKMISVLAPQPPQFAKLLSQSYGVRLELEKRTECGRSTLVGV